MSRINWEKLSQEAKLKESLIVKEEKWTNRIIKFILLFVIIAVVIIASGLYWFFNDSLEPMNAENAAPIEVLVPIGSTNNDIATLLYENKLVKNLDIFKLYMRSKNVNNLQAGTYTFNQSMDADKLIETLKSGGTPIQVDVDKKITVIEGMQLKEIAKLVSENTPITQEEFLDKVNDESFIKQLINKFPTLLNGLLDIENLRYPLEGYLFPATYDYTAGMTVEELIIKMVETANLRFQQIREQVEAHWLTYHQILSLASIVEREGVTTEDRRLIAGVFFNRLDAGMPLQSDITVLYALEQHKEFVTYSDIEVDSPYNLYMYSGITPGPVNSPSLDAIEAVLNPEWSNYYYFVADLDTGDIYYSATIEEHNVLVEQYVNSRQRNIESSSEESSSEVDESSE